MDCPQCGRDGYTPGKTCENCGYLAAGAGMPEEFSEDMPLDELNRMLGALGIEPIPDVVRRTGREEVPPVERVPEEDADVVSPPERVPVEDADDVSPPERVPVEDADDVLSPKSIQVEEASVPIHPEIDWMEKTDLPVQAEHAPMETPVDEIEPSDEDAYHYDVHADASLTGKSLPVVAELTPFDAAEDIPPAVRQTTQPKKRLRDVRYKAGPALSAANLFRSLAGWLPALLAGVLKGAKRQSAVAETKSKVTGTESLMPEGDALAPQVHAPALSQEPAPVLPQPDEGDALLRDLLFQGVGDENPAEGEGGEEAGSGTDPSAGDALEEPAPAGFGENLKNITRREIKPKERKKTESMSPRVKNLIFWIAVPLALVVLVAGVLRFVLVLRDRSFVTEDPKGTEEWHYVPWSPETDIPPTSVTIEAIGSAFIP